jgi:hypothetical protein
LFFKVFARGVRGEEHLGQQQGHLCNGLRGKGEKQESPYATLAERQATSREKIGETPAK